MTAASTSTAVATAAPLTGTAFVARPVTGVSTLVVVVYHYIQEPASARFPRLQGLTVSEFEQQLSRLQERYEIATLDSAVAFLRGDYQPARSLCLLTFDDGLKDHARHVAPRLAAEGLQGVFFVTTACFDGTVATVHKSHHLAAALGFDTYRRHFMRRLAESPIRMGPPDRDRATLAYPWDPPEVADFKYLVNYRLPQDWSAALVTDLFATCLGDEAAFARELYLSPDDAIAMQRVGMIIGGHSDAHQPLAAMPAAAQARDAACCAATLRSRLLPQPHWPFSYPYGSHDATTVAAVAAASFLSGFALEGRDNRPGADMFRIHRIDTKDLAF
jgi:peptidoglycan/xylan/chitin deacetylase (PgdA/CDA1 family)